MEKNKKTAMNSDWKDMSYDVLMRIFMTLNVVDFSSVSMVCSSWRHVCRDALSQGGKVLDLTKWDDPRLQLRSWAIAVLIYLLNLSSGQVNCLIFSFDLFLDDLTFINVARRSGNLKRLVLPVRFPHLSTKGINTAMEQWGKLESLTITTNFIAIDFLEAVGKYCPNFSELKLTCHLTFKIARTLVKNVPKLKVLSLQSIRLNKNAMVYLVKRLKELEVINVSHSFILWRNHPNNGIVYPQPSVPKLLENIKRKPPTLMHCEGFCLECKEVSVWNMTNKWRDPKEQIWLNDMIPTLKVED